MNARTLLMVFLWVPVLSAWQVDALPRAAAESPVAPDGRIPDARPNRPSSYRSQLRTRNPRYQIRPADVLEILFSPTTEFNQSIVVQPDGYVTLREVKDIYVQGKTIPELTEVIAAA